MPKLFIADIDGTLLPHGEAVISKSIVEKLLLFAQNGVVTAVASGRSFDSVSKAFGDNVPDELYIISNDGALCTRGEKVLFKKPISFATCRSLFDFAKQNNADAFFCTESSALIFGQKEAFCTHAAFSLGDREVSSAFELNQPIYKIGLLGEGLKIPLHFDVRVAYDDGFLREYVAKSADKGTALNELNVRTFTHREDIFAMGDGVNDIPMLKKAKLSACIGASSDEVRNACCLHFDTAQQAIEYFEVNLWRH